MGILGNVVVKELGSKPIIATTANKMPQARYSKMGGRTAQDRHGIKPVPN